MCVCVCVFFFVLVRVLLLSGIVFGLIYSFSFLFFCTKQKGNSYTAKCLKISSSTAQERDQCMDIVSNSRIAESEYTRWKDGRRGVRAPTLTVSECTARRLRMNKIVQGHKVTPNFFCGGGGGDR